ncbi:MAG: cytochrome c [Chloroflexi bacterium]|nr:cytochrome c [Chloroflexota bacterium]
MRKWFILIVVLAIAVFVAAACGGGGSSSTGDPAVDAGKKIFEQSVIEGQPGCSTCHSLEPDKVVVGPSLAGLATRAGSMVPGMSAEEYIRQSILEPDAHLVDGFPAGTMPKVWGDVLSEEQLNNLVAFLMTLK